MKKIILSILAICLLLTALACDEAQTDWIDTTTITTTLTVEHHPSFIIVNDSADFTVSFTPDINKPLGSMQVWELEYFIDYYYDLLREYDNKYRNAWYGAKYEGIASFTSLIQIYQNELLIRYQGK